MSLALIAEIVQDLNAGSSFDEVFESIYSKLRGAIPCNRLAVALFDAARRRLTLHAFRSDGPTHLREGYGSGIEGSSLEPLLRSGEPRILNDLEAHLAEHPGSESTRLIVKEGLRSSLSLPLIAHGRPFGVLFFSSRKAGDYTREHHDLARMVAGHISVALERSLLLQELREQRDYLESILASSVDAILVVDRDDRIRTWNRGAELMFGYPASAILGGDVRLLMPPEINATEELETIRESVERDGFLSGYETVRMTADERRIRINLTSTLMRDRHDRITGRCSIMRDVTHQRQLQEDLARSQSLAALGEMSASIAHEIKNPLAGISGAIQVIADAIPVKDPRREIVPEVLAQVRRLDATVRDLLTFARPWVPERRPVVLAEVIDRTAALLRREPKMERISIRREGPESLSAEVDPNLLQEVLVNLVQNAADAMPEGGVVRVAAESRNGSVRLRVIDSGAGMSPEVRAKLFRPFFTTKTRGTGLGLAISKRIVEAHGGWMDIESSPGRGTEVSLTLPKEPSHGLPHPGR